METKRGMYEGIGVPTALHGNEAWVLETKIKNRMNVAEMSCLRSMCRVTKRDRVRNEEIRWRCGLQRSLSESGRAAILWWFGHVERMEEERLVKKIYQADVEGNGGEVDQGEGSLDGVKSCNCLSDRRLNIPDAKECKR